MIKYFKYIFFIAVVMQLSSCYYDVQEDLHPATSVATCDTSNITFTGKVSDIFRVNCYSCHSQSLASGNISLDNYPGVKTVVDDGRLMGSITHAADFRPMPQNQPMLSECDILTIQNWIQNGSSNN